MYEHQDRGGRVVRRITSGGENWLGRLRRERSCRIVSIPGEKSVRPPLYPQLLHVHIFFTRIFFSSAYFFTCIFFHLHIFSSAHILSCISAHPRISLPPQHLYLSRTCLLVFICKYAFGLWTCMRCIIVWAFSGEFFESLSATSTPTVSLR